MRRVVTAVVTAACVLGGCSVDPVTWDRNGDNRFDRSEYVAFAGNHWKWDGNSDERISPEEYENGWTQSGWKDSARAFRVFDRNRDGGISGDEFFPESQWNKLDANGDGVLGASEWTY